MVYLEKIKVVDNMGKWVEIIINIVALALSGAFATFFIVLSTHKHELWELIYEKIQENSKEISKNESETTQR